MEFMVLGKKPPDKCPPYKSQKKTSGWIFFLGFVDPIRKKLASTAYFAISAPIILGAYCRGGLFVRGF